MGFPSGNPRTDHGLFALTLASSASQQFLDSTFRFESLSNDFGSVRFCAAELLGLLSVSDDIAKMCVRVFDGIMCCVRLGGLTLGGAGC